MLEVTSSTQFVSLVTTLFGSRASEPLDGAIFIAGKIINPTLSIGLKTFSGFAGSPWQVSCVWEHGRRFWSRARTPAFAQSSFVGSVLVLGIPGTFAAQWSRIDPDVSTTIWMSSGCGVPPAAPAVDETVIGMLLIPSTRMNVVGSWIVSVTLIALQPPPEA